MRLLAAVLLVATLAACDHSHGGHGCEGTNCTPFDDPLAVDYDTVTTYDYEARIRPLLAARSILWPTATTERSDPAAYTHEAVLMAGPSGFVVPFDAEGSLLVRFVEDLPAETPIPLPNLRNLEADELRYLKRWIEAGARDEHGPGFHDAEHLLYAGVQRENHVAILDGETLRIVRRVSFDDHGIPAPPAGAQQDRLGPHHMAFEPDGSAWYVSLINAGAVVKLSTSLEIDPSDPAYLLGRTPPGAMSYPGMLALAPAGGRLYVGRSSLAPDLSITGFYALDRATMAVEAVETPPGFTLPHAMAVTPDGRFVLTASLSGNRVAVLDTQSGDLTPTPLTGPARELIHFGVLGSAPPYVATLTSRSTDELLFFTLTADGAFSLDAVVPAGDGPYHAHVGHDGRTVLIPDWVGNTVTMVDALTRTVVRTVDAGAPAGPLSRPHSPTPFHDGSRFFVSSANTNGAWTPPYLFRRPDGSETTAADFGNVAAFAANGTLIGVVHLGSFPSGLEHAMGHGGGGH